MCDLQTTATPTVADLARCVRARQGEAALPLEDESRCSVHSGRIERGASDWVDVWILHVQGGRDFCFECSSLQPVSWRGPGPSYERAQAAAKSAQRPLWLNGQAVS